MKPWIGSNSSPVSRKKEKLRKFWNELNGLEAKGNFCGIFERFVKYVFFVSLSNKEVEQKLSTEPKETIVQRIHLAIACEERAIKQDAFDKMEMPYKIPEINEVNNII